MIKRGFTQVYQLSGGIVRYGEEFGNEGRWKGSLTVFDDREAMTFGPNTEIIGVSTDAVAPPVLCTTAKTTPAYAASSPARIAGQLRILLPITQRSRFKLQDSLRSKPVRDQVGVSSPRSNIRRKVLEF